MSASPERLWNRSFILCLLNNLFLFVYYFALLTILPVYIMKDLGGSVKEAGLALTLFLVSSIAVRPFSGMIIEKLGKKLAMRGAGVIFALFAFSYLLVDSMWSLLAVRFLHGIWFSILTTVTVPVANEFIPESRKGEGMGVGWSLVPAYVIPLLGDNIVVKKTLEPLPMIALYVSYPKNNQHPAIELILKVLKEKFCVDLFK